MNLQIFDEQEDLSIDPTSILPVVESVLHLEDLHTDELAIYFVSEPAICSLHERYFQDPSSTDCISFPMDGRDEVKPHTLGEIFISPKAAIEFTKSSNHPPYREVTLYVVHGLLHLLGYDDIEEEDEKKMRKAEKMHMDALLANNLIIRKKSP